MLDGRLLLVFLAAATLLAVTPGPGIFYVLTRTLAGGRREGILSALGTFAGGLIHVVAAGLGLSAVLAASATAFAAIKYAGALYLFWLGVRMVRSRNMPMDEASASTESSHAFRQGIATEVLNPKTALFFLSFLPQFVNPQLGHVVIQFLLLGVMSVSLNTTADLLVVSFAAPTRHPAPIKCTISPESARCIWSCDDGTWCIRGTRGRQVVCVGAWPPSERMSLIFTAQFGHHNQIADY